VTAAVCIYSDRRRSPFLSTLPSDQTFPNLSVNDALQRLASAETAIDEFACNAGSYQQVKDG
jgi:hypothetical protein